MIFERGLWPHHHKQGAMGMTLTAKDGNDLAELRHDPDGTIVVRVMTAGGEVLIFRFK